MDICNYNSNIQFGAKFLKSDALERIVDYTIEKGTYLKLEKAAKNIDKSMLKTRIFVELGTFNEKPAVTFTIYDPRVNVAIPQDFEKDYTLRKSTTYVSDKEKNPLQFAYSIIKRMGSDVPHNKLFRQTVIRRPIERHSLFLVS